MIIKAEIERFKDLLSSIGRDISWWWNWVNQKCSACKRDSPWATVCDECSARRDARRKLELKKLRKYTKLYKAGQISHEEWSKQVDVVNNSIYDYS